MAETLTVYALALLLGWPLGRYMTAVFGGGPAPGDALFLPLERLLYRAIGIDPARGMSWRGYARALLVSNLVLGAVVYPIFLFQHRLPLNPDGIGPLSWDLALHTLVSFLTNTNQQHYSGQAQLSYFAQLAGLVTLQMTTPMVGLAAVVAILRGLRGGRDPAAPAGSPRDLGNYWVDLTRGVVRLMLPLCVVLGVLLASQGVPATLAGAADAQPLDPDAGVTGQALPLGPVAPMVAVKQLGTNGGGWYGPNSSVPHENPTALSNLLETLAIILIPVGTAFMAGGLLGRPRFTVLTLGVMLGLSVISTGTLLWSERAPNAALAGLAAPGPNMEGKEVRFGHDASALWAALTTQTSNGSVNAMHDSLNPAGGAMVIGNMLVNSMFGGVGVGLINFLVFLWLTVFLAGLMIGRTPELWGRKLETAEVRLLAVLAVLPTLVILGATAIALAFPAITANSNPGFHGLAQVLYEYVSAFANNGSGFEGLGDNTPWWNLSCVVVLLVGRYLPIVLPLAIAGGLATRRVAPDTAGSLRVETVPFALTLVTVILLLTLLSFLPALVLGPIGEALSLAHGR